MPTPFTHLEINQRLLVDPAIPGDLHDLLVSQLAAFTLGGVAADARVGSGVNRAETHFYDYREEVVTSPWRVMVRRYPELMKPKDSAHRAFIAAYVAHLSVDEVWTLRIVRPHFGRREWASRNERFLLLHILLTYMDERDFSLLEDWVCGTLAEARPCRWLAFIDELDLIEWRDLIHRQLIPDGLIQTLEIFSQRIDISAKTMRAILDSPKMMERRLWQYIPRSFLQRVEDECYLHAREQMRAYLRETD